MHTIHDVARLAGVSIGTVSNVINNSNKVRPETAKKVLEAINELDYVPNSIAKSLKTNSSRVIGVLAEDVGFFAAGDIIAAICEYSEANGYYVNLCTLNMQRYIKGTVKVNYKEIQETEVFKNGVKNNINTLLNARVCGLIYIGIHPRDVGGILPALPIPVVYTYCYTEKKDYCINYDDYQGARLAVEYMVKQGHKRIGLISGPIDSVPTVKRMQGYQDVLTEHNIPFLPELIKTGNWRNEDGYHCCRELLELEQKPTAIFAMSDLMATGALKQLHERGYRVPEDIGLHAFDNTQLSEFSLPSISTVDLPLEQMGEAASRTLTEILSGNTQSNQKILIPCTHIPRKSV